MPRMKASLFKKDRPFLAVCRRPICGWLQLAVFLIMTMEPLCRVQAVYVPNASGNPYWLPLHSNDTEPSAGPYSPDENGNGWEYGFQAALANNFIAWWGGGTYYIDGQQMVMDAQYHLSSALDGDGDGIPDDLDPHPLDSSNNSFYWSGGTFTISNSPRFFEGGYYVGSYSDPDGDNIPEAVDPFPNDIVNGNSMTSWWPGGTFLINNVPTYYAPVEYSGMLFDNDSDGLPNDFDPYPDDGGNGNTTYQNWGGGSFLIDGVAQNLGGGDFPGAWSDIDSDTIPDYFDPYPGDSANNSAWWGGGSFMIDAQTVTATGQWHRANADDVDTDGLPDDLDPYPNDVTNNTSWFNGGRFWIHGTLTEIYPQFYPGPPIDGDRDGIPDVFDPYAQDSTNSTSWWNGGDFLLNGAYSHFDGQYFAGQFLDSDGDGIPNALDPQVNDAWNGTAFSWAGGSYSVDGGVVNFTGGIYNGLWSDQDGDGIPDVVDPYPESAANNSSWWQGGRFLVNGIYVTRAGQYVRADQAGDQDGDGIPNGVDAYPADNTNNSIWWNGGHFWINDATVIFAAKYYPGNGHDQDADGIPDTVDPWPLTAANGSTVNAFWWNGGTFNVSGMQSVFAAKFYIGVWADSDGDGIPNSQDPYPNDPSNLNITYYWQGGYFLVGGMVWQFSAQRYAGTWSDSDGDTIPDPADPEPGVFNADASNGYSYFSGCSSYSNGVLTTFPSQFVMDPTDSDRDALPDALDPYPNDASNNTSWTPLHARPGYDSDGDNVPDYLDPEPNDACNGATFVWPSSWEGQVFLINNQSYTFSQSTYGGVWTDLDNDQIPDVADPFPYEPYNNNDTDQDGIPDQVEVQYGYNRMDASDASRMRADGLTNLQAYLNGLPLDTALMDPALDSDGDGMKDAYEIANSLLPFDPMDAIQAPRADYVFNLEKATHSLPATTVVGNSVVYHELTGHWSTDGLVNVPSKSDAENDWDRDGVSNIDEIWTFQTDPREESSRPSASLIRIAILQSRVSLTTRANFLWALGPSEELGHAGDPSNPPTGAPGAGSPQELDTLDEAFEVPEQDPLPIGSCACPGVGLNCRCGSTLECGGTGLAAQCMVPACVCGCARTGCECGLPSPSGCPCGCELECCVCHLQSPYACTCGCGKECCTCHGTGNCKNDTRNYDLPLDDASGARFRKIALNGRPLADEKPQHTAESDQEKEETYIDAMSLGLRHSVTDIFISIPGSDLTLSARRNATATVWNMKSGLRPHERRDRPFGAGWTSSLAPTAEFVTVLGEPTVLLVTDENGTIHRFTGAGNGFVPWPTSCAENSDHLTKFEGSEQGGTYTSRYGTKIVFVPSGKFFSIPSERWRASSDPETHRYLRASTITDRMGKAVQFSYSGNTLIPDSIATVDNPEQAVSIRHNQQGLVTAIWEPNGRKTEFQYGLLEYALDTYKYKAPVLTAVRRADGSEVQYNYSLARQPINGGDEVYKYHLDLAAIRDALGRNYEFEYSFDCSKWSFKDTDKFKGYYVQTGSPRNVTKTKLPDGRFATFENQSKLRLEFNGWTETVPRLHADSIRRTLVTDAANSGVNSSAHRTTYTWATPEVHAVDAGPKLVYFKKMTVQYGNVGTQVYEFDPDAGMAVTNVTDLSGNITSFYYADTFSGASTFQSLFSTPVGVNGRYGDPTTQTNANLQMKRFVYDQATRIMKKSTDEAGRVTVNEIDAKGRRLSETIKAAEDGPVVQTTEFLYENASFPGVVTQQTVRSLGDAGSPGNLVRRYVLDAAGRVQQEIVDPDGLHLVTASTYDLNGNKLTSTDPNRYTTSFSYDMLNRLVGVEYPDHTKKRFDYDAAGNKVRETDENGYATQFVYDAMNRLSEQRRLMPTGGPLVTKFGYNEVGSKLWTQDPNGHTTTIAYDGLQRPTNITDALGRQTQLEYGVNSGANAFDSSGFKPTRVTDPNGYVTETDYDKLYRATEVRMFYEEGTPPAVTVTDYDEVGNPIQVTDPLSRSTLHTYDALNRVITTTFPDLTTASSGYTSTGLKWKTVDELGHEANIEYDLAGRPVRSLAPALAGGVRAITETIYDAAGNAVAMIDAMGRRTEFSFDSRNRKVREEAPEVWDAATAQMTRPTTDTVYDGVGNVVTVIDPRNSATTTVYDAANRKVQVILPPVAVAGEQGEVQPSTQTTYDAAGNALVVKDAKGRFTVNTYDAMNRLLTTTDGAGITVRNEYDAAGNRTAVIDGKWQRTEFTYDGLKRNQTTKNALGYTTTYHYDAVNKTGRTDANGQVTAYGYDGRNRLTTVQYTGREAENREYRYNDAGQLLEVVEPGKGDKADVVYSYDALGRVVTETSGGVTHQYTYDLVGNRLTTVYGGTGRRLVSSYDAMNRLSTVTESLNGNGGGRVTQYQYDRGGNVVRKVLPNGDTVVTDYDRLGRARSISGGGPNGRFLYHYAQSLDRMSNVVGLTEQTALLPPRTVSMAYDGVDRLTSEEETINGQTTTTAYRYDAANNRVGRTKTDANGSSTAIYSYDQGNRLVQVTEGNQITTFGYDAAGSRVSRNRNGATDAAYTYDAEQRLVNLAQGGHAYSYVYDYRTRRVERNEDAAATKVVFSGGTSVREEQESSAPVEYIRGSDWGGGVGGILYTLRDGEPSFTHYDSRGDVTAKTSSSGAVTYQSSYEAFGTRVQEEGSTSDRQKANTKEEDPSGLLNEGMRYRDLETGTFITADPEGFVDGPNLYAYVVQNPWTKFDPEGLCGYALNYPQGWWDSHKRDLQNSAAYKNGFNRGAGVAVTAIAVFAYNLIPGVGEMNDLADAEQFPEGSPEWGRARASAMLGILTFGLSPNRAGTRRMLQVVADSMEADAIRGTKRAVEIGAKETTEAAGALKGEVHPLDRDAKPFPDITGKQYEGGIAPDKVVVDHVKNRAAGGSVTDPNNLDPKTWEANSRKAGFEGNLAKDRAEMIRAGMDPADVDIALAPEKKWVENDVHAVPLAPEKFKKLPSQ